VFSYPSPNLCSNQNHPDNQQLKNEEEIIKERLAKVCYFCTTVSSSVRNAFILKYLWLYTLETIFPLKFPVFVVSPCSMLLTVGI
jgi:hypothetical protein